MYQYPARHKTQANYQIKAIPPETCTDNAVTLYHTCSKQNT